MDRYLEEYRKTRKASSYSTAKQSLKRFENDFGRRPLTAIGGSRRRTGPPRSPPARSPPWSLCSTPRSRTSCSTRTPSGAWGGRAGAARDQPPPTPEEVERLDKACDALDGYAPTMRALFRFARYTALRPGEIFALTWQDIDLEDMRVHVRRRLYRQQTDIPKSNRTRTVVLPPPARDAVLGLPRGEYVFTSKTGKRLSSTSFSPYWQRVQARAGLRFDFYLACRHYCAWFMLSPDGLNLPRAVVREQMGHLDESLLDLYGHEDVGALERIDRAYRDNVVPLRIVK
jgi:integrase